MRALLVCAVPTRGSAELVAALASEADLVVAVDAGGAVCRQAGVRPDLLVGDFDSIDRALVDEAVAEGIEVRAFPAEKDATDLELAIDAARSLGANAITVTAATSGRLDHTLGVLAAIAGAADLLPRIVEPHVRGWLLAEGGRRALALSGAGATVSLVPFGGAATVSATGLRWPLDHAVLSPSSTLGISNVITSTHGARVDLHSGAAYVFSPLLEQLPAAERV